MLTASTIEPIETAPAPDGEHLEREHWLAEQEILRQSFEEKNRRLCELGIRIQVLEELLQRRSIPMAALAPRSLPRRWSPR